MIGIPDSKDEDDDGPTKNTEGTFEREFHLDHHAGEFLVHPGEQLGEGTQLGLPTEEWRRPFERRGAVEREVEFLGFGDREFEIELTGPPGESHRWSPISSVTPTSISILRDRKRR